MMIYWVTITFAVEVHAGPLGFTRQVYDFVEASSEKQARALVQTHYETRHEDSFRQYGNHVLSVTAKPALEQSRLRYISLLGVNAQGELKHQCHII